MLLTKLPIEILLTILSYLEIRWKRSYVNVNFETYLNLLKKVKQIYLTTDVLKNQIYKCMNYEKVDNPYEQVSFTSEILEEDIYDPFFQSYYSWKSLNIHVAAFTRYLLTCPVQVQGLRLKLYDRLQLSALEELFLKCSQKLQEGSLGLKHLELHMSNTKTLPAMIPVESLEINGLDKLIDDSLNLSLQSALGTLRKLELVSCSNITDVSALGYIHDLTLSHCKGIKDISKLNHNYSITIDYCNGITDYSKSFEYSSKVITLIASFSKAFSTFDYSRMKQIRSLNVGYVTFTVRSSEFQADSLPSSLTELGLRNMTNHYISLPEHGNIKKVRIVNGAHLKSIDNLHQVKFLSIENSSSLKELSGNFEIVRLIDLGERQIDISRLICKELFITSDLSVIFIQNVSNPVENEKLQVLEHFSLTALLFLRYYKHDNFFSNLHSLEIYFEESNFQEEQINFKSLLSKIIRFHQIKKIIFTNINEDISDMFIALSRTDYAAYPYYKGQEVFQLVLLKRRSDDRFNLKKMEELDRIAFLKDSMKVTLSFMKDYPHIADEIGLGSLPIEQIIEKTEKRGKRF